MGIRNHFRRFAFATLAVLPLVGHANGAALPQLLAKLAGRYAITADQPTVCLGSLDISYDAEASKLKAGDFHTFVRINQGETVENRDDGMYTVEDETVLKGDKLLHVRVETQRDMLAEVASYVKSRRRSQFIVQMQDAIVRTTEVASDGFVLSCNYKRAE